MLTTVEAVAAGVLIGELVAGIPLSRRIARYERRKRRSSCDSGGLGLDATIIDDWPYDHAAAMLAAWRAQRGGQTVHAVGRAADADSARAARAVTDRGRRPGPS